MTLNDLDPGMTDTRTDFVSRLRDVTTATLTTVLLKHGLRNVWMRGTRPLRSDQKRIVGPAFTLRFIPFREDLATPAAWSAPISTRTAVEAMPNGCVAVVDAMGCTDAGIFGDILCARMVQRGVAALVSDGVIRDAEGIGKTALQVWCQGVAAPPAVSSLTFVHWDQPIGCGGVAVFPGDLIVADGDGAIALPSALAADIVDEAVEQERAEEWILAEVNRGTPLGGLYPMNEQTRARYLKFGGKA